jgi:hypothetical protein
MAVVFTVKATDTRAQLDVEDLRASVRVRTLTDRVRADFLTYTLPTGDQYTPPPTVRGAVQLDARR